MTGTGDFRIDLFQASMRFFALRGGEALLGPLTDESGNEKSPFFEHACEVFEKSLFGDAFPSFWFEASLMGETGFDLHLYYDRPELPAGTRFAEGAGYGCQAAFDWFIERETGGIGLGFAHDLRDDADRQPALYVNFNGNPLKNEAGLFEAIGRPEAGQRYQELASRLPNAWRRWYLGLFPGRPHSPVRTGSFVDRKMQERYAIDAALLGRQMRAVGFTAYDDDLLKKVRQLARLPLGLEFQFDMLDDGNLGSSFPLSVCLKGNGIPGPKALFASHAWPVLGELLGDWGVVDERFDAISRASFARLFKMDLGESGAVNVMLSANPSFLKLKWTDGVLAPAKVYFQCQARILEL